jgi:membrane protease YdiL (CAAX protease family)
MDLDRPQTSWGPSKRLTHTVELLAFLALLAPSMILSMLVSGGTHASFVLVAVATILRDLGLLALVLFFVWRDSEPLVTIGWTTRRAGREALLGLLLFFPMTTAAAAVELALQALGMSVGGPVPALTPEPGAQTALALALVVVVAVAEETIFRGYLLHRLREATHGNTPLAVGLQGILFATGHKYEGVAGMTTACLLGVVFALVYLWRRSLVAPGVMHFCQDLSAIVLVPTLTHGR